MIASARGPQAFLTALFILTACNANQMLSPGVLNTNALSAQTADPQTRQTASKIQHVVIIVQENRSLNNLFYGFPGAKTVAYGYDSYDQKVNLRPVSLAIKWDLAHYATGELAACNGVGSIPGTDCRMNGFNREKVTRCGGSGEVRCPKMKDPQYAYVPHDETKPYFDMGRQYVLADEMYSSNFDASSFISHQYIIAGQAESAVNYPSNIKEWGCPGGQTDTIDILNKDRTWPHGTEIVCWDPTTLGDELDKVGLPWAFYAGNVKGNGGIWSAYQAIKHIYDGPDWAQDIITPQTQFFDDVSNGKLRTVSWITPSYQNSDHAGSGSKTGPSWVASLVNAIGESKYWSSTAIFIFWDDYGGWYDSEAPAYADYDGLGFRLPLLIISPFAKRGFVSHTHYEHGSILKFVEDQFGLPRLSASDMRAKSPELDCFDFSQPPRKFVKIKAPQDAEYFLRQPADLRPPDTE